MLIMNILLICLVVAQLINRYYHKKSIQWYRLETQKILQNKRLLIKSTSSVLWNIANQREKVSGNLKSILKMLYPDSTEEKRLEIKNKIMKNIK